MRDIIADPTRSIVLGRPGENEATLVKFPIAHWVEQFGNTGMFTLVHKRFEDEDVYPCVVKWDSTAEYVSWVIKEYDVLKVGTGTAVLSYTINNQIVKSKTFDTIVLDTVVVPSEAPDPYKDWVEEVTNTVGEMWEKMNTVESGAQVNVIEKITDNAGTELTVEEKTVKLPDFALSTDLANKIDRPKTAFNKQVLTYNAEKSTWEADDPQGGGESSTKIKQLCDIVYDDEGNPADFVFKYTPQELFPDVDWETGARAYEIILNTIYLFVPTESMNAPFAYLTDIEPDFENEENGTVSGIAFCVGENEILTCTFGPVKKGESVLETLNDNWTIRVPDGTEIDLSNYYTKSETYTKAETDEKIASIDLTPYAKTETVETELAKKQDNLTAGQNVTISNNVISVDLSEYEKATDVDTKLATKQDTLTAGDNVKITGNTVSVDLSAYAKSADLGVYATQTYVQEAIYGAMEASY